MERRVFISYSRRDQNRVLPFVEQLRAAGYHPWLDQRSIPVSVPWLAEINHAIRSAELAIVLDSPHWRASTNCATEATMLRQLGKSVVALDVSSDAATWLDTVNSSYAQVAPAELVRAELLGDSDRWVAAGRPASHLPTGGTLRAFKRIAPAARDGVSEEFLRAARGLTRRKRVLGVLAGLLTFLLWTSWRSAIEMETAVEKTYAESLANLADVTAVTNQISSDPYLGLRAAIAHMDRYPGSLTSRWVLSEALDVSLPTQLTRGSDARAATLGPVTSSSGYRASYDTARRRVRIEAPDHQVTYVGSGVSNALAWAPEEPTLAIGQSTGILIVDARTGAVVNTLRGLRDTVTSMQWNSDDELVASDGTFRATWTTHSAKLLGTTNAWFMHMASNADRTRSLAVARDGSYVVLDGNRVGDRQTISGAVQGLAVGWVGDRWIVGSRDRSGKGTLTGITDDGRVVDQMGIGDCQPSWIAQGTESGTAVVACFADFGYLTVNVEAKSTERTSVDIQPVTLTASRGDVVLAGYTSELMRVHAGQASLMGDWAALCTGTELLVPSDDGSKVLMSGQSARSGCTRVIFPAEAARRPIIVPDLPDMTYARSAAWTTDGRSVAVGFASGEVWVFDVEDFFTRQISAPSGSEVRGLAFSSDNSSLTVVTRDGEVMSLPMGLTLADDATRLAEAKRRLQIGIDAGRVK